MTSMDGQPTIRTYTGLKVSLVDLDPNDVRIEDIAHALASAARFNGHTRVPYSVAQHSVFVAEHLSPDLALQGLLHDAAEAYVVDIPTPLKRILTNYKEIEDGVQRSICKAFGIPEVLDPQVKIVDSRALATEGRDLHHPTWHWQDLPQGPYEERIVHAWTPEEAELNFLNKFYQLSGRGQYGQKIFNKLVRDKIPEIIRLNGDVPEVEKLDPERFKIALLTKLIEEAREAQRASSVTELIAELADLKEVIEAIQTSHGITDADVQQIFDNKRDYRGAFTEGLFLRSTYRDPSAWTIRDP